MAVFRTPLLDALVYFHRERLTARGRYLLWTTVVFALLGLDALRSQVFLLFAAAAGVLMVALLFTAWPLKGSGRQLAIPARRLRRTVRWLAGWRRLARQFFQRFGFWFPGPFDFRFLPRWRLRRGWCFQTKRAGNP